MSRIVSTCAVVVAGAVVLAVSAQTALAFAACDGDMSTLPVPSVLWLLSGGLFSLAALGRRANGS